MLPQFLRHCTAPVTSSSFTFDVIDHFTYAMLPTPAIFPINTIFPIPIIPAISARGQVTSLVVIFKAALALARSLLKRLFYCVVLLLSAIHRKTVLNPWQVISKLNVVALSIT